MTSEESSGTGLAPDEQRRAVRRRYARIAAESSEEVAGSSEDTGEVSEDAAKTPGDSSGASSCCGDTAAAESSGCCDGGDTAVTTDGDDLTQQLGYSEDEEAAVADGANLGLGCGNPNAIAALEPGETVLDLGSGAGFDCFLAAREVGEEGRVVGVDMTPEMVEAARDNVRKNDATNVEFRLGEIEHLPVADATVDVVISNCVVNLSPDKRRVFEEAHRVLRAGGRLAISDVVLTAPVPAELRADPESVASCVAGASPVEELASLLADAGFEGVSIDPKESSERFIREWDDAHDVSDYVVSATIEARKPH